MRKATIILLSFLSLTAAGQRLLKNGGKVLKSEGKVLVIPTTGTGAVVTNPPPATDGGTAVVEPLAVQTFYFDPVNGSNSRTGSQAQSSTTPWRDFGAIAANNVTVSPGTHFVLKGGRYGAGMLSYNSIPMTLAINSDRGWQGTASNPILIKAAPGEIPILTNYATATNPVAVAGRPNVYAYAVSVFEELSVVEIDGHVRENARYPERVESGQRGYLMGRTKSGGGMNATATLTASFIPSFSVVGGDLVTRNNEYQIFSHPITAQRSKAVDFYNTSFSGMEDQFGTYFQNHLNILNSNFDWAFKSGTTDSLYVYFADNNPAAHTVRYATSNYITWVLNGRHIWFKDVAFQGANVHGAKLQNVRNIQFYNCSFTGMGRNAVWATGSADSTTIRGNSVKHCFAGAFDIASAAVTTIENNILDSIGLFAVRPTRNVEIAGGVQVGTFTEGFHGEGAVIARGHNAKVNGNTIFHVGQNGVIWNGFSAVVNGNYINYTNLRNTDGGAIYSYNTGLPDYTSAQVRYITNNTILNVVGDPGGTPNTNYSPVFGIYNDDETNRVNITNNTIAYISRAGIYNHHTQYIVASNNKILDAEYGYYTRYGDNESTKLPVGNTFSFDLVASDKTGQIEKSLTVVQRGVFANVTPESTATFTGINYYPFDPSRGLVLIANATGQQANVTYFGGPYKNITTGNTIGASPLLMQAYASFIGYYNLQP